MSRTTLGNHNIPIEGHGQPIRIQHLSFALPTFSKGELEAPLVIEDLDAMIIRISHENFAVLVDGNPTGLAELSVVRPKITKLDDIWYFHAANGLPRCKNSGELPGVVTDQCVGASVEE